MYAIIKCVNGNFFIDSEGYASLGSAIVQYHGVCRALWNESSVITACVMIVNEYFDLVENYKEIIKHEAAY